MRRIGTVIVVTFTVCDQFVIVTYSDSDRDGNSDCDCDSVRE